MAIFTIQVDDKASGASEKIVHAMGDLITKMQGAGVAVDSLNIKMGGAGAHAKGMGAAFSSAVDPMAGLTTAASGLGVALNPVTLMIAAVALTAAAATAIVTGLAMALYAGVTAAIQFAEQRRGLVSSLGALTDGGGKQAVQMLDELGKRLPYTTAQMGEWAKKVAGAGARDLPSMKLGVQAVAAATAVLGDEGGQKVIGLIQRYRLLAEAGAKVKIDTKAITKLKDSTVDINDVARALGTTATKMMGTSIAAADLGNAIQKAIINKGKGALEDLGLSWDTISAKFKENVGSLFEGVGDDAKAFMGEVRGIADEFTRGSATSTVAKSAIGAVFHVIFDLGTRALHAVHIGFLQLEILALKAAIAVAPTVLWLRRMWAEHDGAGKLVTTLEGLAVVLGVVAVAGALAMLPLAIAAAVAIGSVLAVSFAIGWLIDNVGAAGTAISKWASDAYDSAGHFVSGLVQGLEDGIASVGKAASKLGRSAIDAVEGVLHIKSPSRVMMNVGVNTARGMAMGIDDGAPDVARSAAALGAVAPAAVAKASGTNGAGQTINIKLELVVNNHGGPALELTEDALASLLERAAATAGLIPAGAM